MATAAQVNANRLNAKVSTGPRTEEGKSRTKLNAVTHGCYAAIAVIPGERLEQWHSFCGAYVADKAPVGLPQILCVEEAALAEWKLKRMNDLERMSCESLSPEEFLADISSEYTHQDDMWKKQTQRIENHLIRIRDKHLAQFRLHKKDTADEGEEPRKAKISRQRESVAATIPVAVQPDPQAASPVGAPAAEAAGKDVAELNRWRRIREETEKFISHLQSCCSGLSPVEISQKIENHLNEIGLPYPPEPEGY